MNHSRWFNFFFSVILVLTSLLAGFSPAQAAPPTPEPNALPQCEAQPILWDVTLKNGPEIKAKAMISGCESALTFNWELNGPNGQHTEDVKTAGNGETLLAQINDWTLQVGDILTLRVWKIGVFDYLVTARVVGEWPVRIWCEYTTDGCGVEVNGINDPIVEVSFDHQVIDKFVDTNPAWSRKYVFPSGKERILVGIKAWNQQGKLKADYEQWFTNYCYNPGSVSATKIDQFGNPWAGVTVNLYKLLDQGEKLINTDVTPYAFSGLEYGKYRIEEIPPVGSVPMGPVSYTFEVTAENLSFDFQFQNRRVEVPTPHVHAYKFEITWDEEGYPYTLLYVNTKKIIKEVEDNEGIGIRTQGDFGRTWEVDASFEQYIVICTDDGANCRVRVALIMSGQAPENSIFSGRYGIATIGKETFPLNAKSEKARDMKICTLKEFKDLGFCP